MLNALRFKVQNFDDEEVILPIFTNSFHTFEKLMDSFLLQHVFDRIARAYAQPNVENTLKVLIRIKFMLGAREKFADILTKIEEREVSSALIIRQERFVSLKKFVFSCREDEDFESGIRIGDDPLDAKHAKIRDLATELSELTSDLIEQIRLTLEEHKTFGRSFIYEGKVGRWPLHE